VFSGTNSEFLTNPKNLYYLDLSFNDLSGSIPSKLLKLPNVWKTDLSASNLSGKTPHSTFR